jgi:hypothetical protein
MIIRSTRALSIRKETTVGLLSGLFGQKQDPLQERAAMLVKAADINAIGMFTPLLNDFAVLREVDVKHWDFVVTVAGVFMAATRLNNLRLSDARKEKLMEVVAKDLAAWDPDGIRAFENCKGLFESEFDRLTAAGHESRFIAADAVGQWIVLNVLKRAPQTEQECMLVRATGAMVTHDFFDWWKS